MITETPVVLSGGTLISWAHWTHNPWWGCTRVSPACDHCYAESLAARFANGLWEKDGPRRFFDEKHLNKPYAWNRKAIKNGTRYRVFCASMADVFEDRADLNEERSRLWTTIERTPNLDWMLLTKRPQHVMGMVPVQWVKNGFPSNVWTGTTVENQRYANVRIPHLLKVPSIRFISCEPLLGPLDLTPWLGFENGIDWVIVGGESGRKPRPMMVDWARGVRDQCAVSRTAFHFKQFGEWMPYQDAIDELGYDDPIFARAAKEVETGDLKIITSTDPRDPTTMIRVGKHAAGRTLDGRTWDEFPA